MGAPNATRTGPRFGHFHLRMQDLVEALDADRHDRDVEPRADHADAGAERADLALVLALAFREDQDRVAVGQDLADVAQRLPRARLALRQRERVEELARRGSSSGCS